MTQVSEISEHPMCSVRNEDVVGLDVVVAIIRFVEALYVTKKNLKDWSKVCIHVPCLSKFRVFDDLLREILEVSTLQ